MLNMQPNLIKVCSNIAHPIVIKKWKVRKGMPVSFRQVLFLYDHTDCSNGQQLNKFKSTEVGTVENIAAPEGTTVRPGDILLTLEECSHPTVMRDMCAECGADLRQSDSGAARASVPMVHSIPELKVSEEQAQDIGKADEARLLNDRKLVLLVDLDQTLVHTTNDNIPPNIKDVVHFQLYGPQSPWYHTKIRPGTEHFLEAASQLYELHICTFGARNYAHYIAMFLDPDGRFFSHRILSRDECFDANSKTANLKALFPCGDKMVCIIDDREDVWNYVPNLIHVKPYHFFQHTGDIHAPPGLSKTEHDRPDGGFDFSVIDDGEQKEVEKKASKNKAVASGETTTDKDTEDEEDIKTGKATKNDYSLGEVQNEPLPGTLTPIADEITGANISENKKDCEVKNDCETTDEKVSALGKKEGEVKPLNSEEIEVPKDSSVDVSKQQEEVLTGKEVDAHNGPQKTDATVVEQISMECDVTTEQSDKDKSELVTETEAIELNKSVQPETKAKEGVEEVNKEVEALIEVEDTDDYLLHLEDILKKIHEEYYKEYDKIVKQSNELPDLKKVIPSVKSRVLEGCELVFSGLVPSHVPLERSRAFLVAKSLGASVRVDLTPTTTHLVAARAGTAKVNASRRQKGVMVVTPDWLWLCAERWERVDERLYPLARGTVTSRHPPAHCSTPQPLQADAPPPKFSDTINPLLTLSSEEVAMMDQEVADLCADSEESDSDEAPQRSPLRNFPKPKQSDEEDSEDSLAGGHSPKGWTEDGPKRKRKLDTTTCTESDLEEESPSVKFRRGEPLPSDLDLGEVETDTVDDSPDDSQDDAAWCAAGAALERQFLS